MNVFSIDGKLARILNRIGDLMFLNFMTILFSIPVITAGAAFSSMYQLTLKMVRGEEGPLFSSFLSAFRENFRQATLIYLIGGGTALFLLFDIRLLGRIDYPFVKYYQAVLAVLFVLVVLFTYCALVVQARFRNTFVNTLKNSLLFCLIDLPKSILMLLLTSCPIAFIYLSYRALSVIVLVGLSGPAFLASYYFRTIFDKYQ